MCGIVYLKAGQEIPDTMLFNLVWNNWHSFGLIVRSKGRLEVIKQSAGDGEIDPYVVKALLEKHSDNDRFLHCRHNTAGSNDDMNTHPMTVYKDKRRHVEFMHNGTLYNFKSKKPSVHNPATMVDDDDGPSDTRNFADKVLKPILSSMDTGNGRGDIESDLFGDVISKYWSTGNRGLLISSDQTALYIGDWKMVGPEGNQFKASNDDYFTEVKRGPEFIRRSVRQEEAKKAAANASVKYTNNIASLKDYRLDSPHEIFELKSGWCNVTDDWDMYDREHCVTLGAATADELEDLYSHKKECLIVMDWVFTDYWKLYEEHLELQEKHERATKHIATLVEQRKAS